MNMKRILSGPIIWVVVALIVLWAAFSVLARPKVERIDTYQGIELLNEGKVESALIVDGDQRVQLDLKSDFEADGKNYGKSVQFYYVEPQGSQVVDAVVKADPPKGYDSQIAQASFWSSLLSLVIPFLIIGLIFWFLLSRMQGGGNRVMGFGKSRAKLITKDMPQVTFADVAGEDEAVEELQEIKEFLADPAKFQAVGAKIPKGVLLYGPPAPARRCSRAPSRARRACRSTRSPARTSSRCSWASAPAACATCSTRPSRTHPRSSSSTRSTPSGATAARAWAAATTSASRR
ncbi:hypothetical protein GCM10025864_06830 [Luteimicrobium album]|uniref:Peptidase M41 FtsH extracellular domain-containing protein n=1 Tax=Luteimicrobium album TaxID=1054550 RepID=A0ABQ6HZH9_9MICO|nr:hypothetical protein GCM10025864_06830 [Luteimicrobium album]